MTDWQRRHADALRAPRTRDEVMWRSILETLATLAGMHAVCSERFEDDYVLGESIPHTAAAVVELATAARALLNGELGRLDGSLLDAAIRAQLEAVGVDPDDV